MATKITIIIDDIGNENEKELATDDDRVSVSQYARFFDESSPAWRKDAEYNMIFLRQQEIYATDLLRARGHLFLNDVYGMLGIPCTKAGQVVGWIYDEKNPIGDNCVDFGLYDQCNKDFINGYKNIILLDFNVDGIILDKVL